MKEALHQDTAMPILHYRSKRHQNVKLALQLFYLKRPDHLQTV